MPKPPAPKTVETLCHEEDKRANIPTAEYESLVRKEEQDWSELVVYALPLYIQEKVHPKVLIDDLVRRSEADRKRDEAQIDSASIIAIR
jgi:adenine-specific DNA-methyltransferase